MRYQYWLSRESDIKLISHRYLRRHIKPALGGIMMRDLRPEHLQHFYNEQKRDGLSVRTVRYCHTLLFGALSQAEKNQLVVKNVALLVEPPRKQRREMPTLTQDQVANRLLPVVAKDRLAAAVFLLFGTGLRKGELLGLRWQDISSSRKVNIRLTHHAYQKKRDFPKKADITIAYGKHTATTYLRL